MFMFRTATLDDAEQIAEVIIKTGEGIAEHLLDGLIPGLTAGMLLAAALRQQEGPYRIENVLRSTHGDVIAGLLFSYPSSEHGVPPMMKAMLPARRLEAVRPILERSVPDSLYINSFWIAEQFRGQGYSDALLLEAVGRCRSFGLSRISLFCWNDNEKALRFYARKGFTIHEHMPREQIPLNGHRLGGSLLSYALPGEEL